MEWGTKIKLPLPAESLLVIGCRCCDIIVLDVQARTEDKMDDMKDRFYDELERVFDKYLKCHMKILLGDFNSKVQRENIFKPTIRNESLHKISNN
jgi:exonuclease III